MFKEDNIIPLSMLRKSFLNKSRFTGSYKDKRYIFQKIKEENIDKLVLYIYNDEFCFEKTNESNIEKHFFEYSVEGIKEGIDFLEKYFDV